MAQLLALTEAETEDCLSDMVSTVMLRICRTVPILWRDWRSVTCAIHYATRDVQMVADTTMLRDLRDTWFDLRDT